MPYNPYGTPGFPAPYISSGTNDIAGITWVSSLQEVQSAIVPYGKQLFMHRSEKQFFIKDHTGVMKAFKFEEMPLPSNDPANFVTKAEFEELRQKYESLVQQQTNTYTTNWNEPVATNATTEELQWNTGTSTAGVLQQSGTDGINQVPIEQPA